MKDFKVSRKVVKAAGMIAQAVFSSTNGEGVIPNASGKVLVKHASQAYYARRDDITVSKVTVEIEVRKFGKPSLETFYICSR